MSKFTNILLVFQLEIFFTNERMIEIYYAIIIIYKPNIPFDLHITSGGYYADLSFQKVSTNDFYNCK